MTEDARPDDVVEACRRELAQIVQVNDASIRQLSGGGLQREVRVQNGSGDRILATQDLGEVGSPQSASGAQLEDRLAREDMEAVPNGQRSPAQLHRGCRREPAPVGLAGAFHRAQVALERHRIHYLQRATRRSTICSSVAGTS